MDILDFQGCTNPLLSYSFVGLRSPGPVCEIANTSPLPLRHRSEHRRTKGDCQIPDSSHF